MAREQHPPHRPAYFVQSTPERNPSSELEVASVPVPSPRATLGDLRVAIRVTGRPSFEPTIVLQPVDPSELIGIDPASVRVFRVDQGTWSPIWESGLNLGLGYVWMIIRHTGVYVPIGLPRDRLLRAMLRDVAAHRRLDLSISREQAQGVTTRRILAPLLATPRHALQELRQMVACAEATGATDPSSLAGVRRGHAGAITTSPLPGDAPIEEFVERVRALDTPQHGLPEEAIFSQPHISSENVAPWLLPTDGELRAALADDVRPLRLPDLARHQFEAGVGRATAVVPASANWWMYHHDPLHSGLVTDSHISRSNVGALQLRARLELGGPVVSVPAVVGNAIYVGIGNSRWARWRSGGTLFKIDLLSGTVLRTFNFDTPRFQGSRQGMAGIACTPSVVNGRVYFSGLDGKLYCLDADTLIPIWITNMRTADPAHNQPVTHKVAAEGWSSPLVINNRVYVGWGESESNTFGFLYCLDAASGRVIWLFCTTVFPGMTDNEPNIIPRSVVGMQPLPPMFRVHVDPAQRGGSPWSSCAYDPVSNRVIVGTGNVLPQHPLPQPRYSLGVLSLDATTGRSVRFFQPAASDNYRPDDSDVDVAAGPTVFAIGAQRVVAIGSKNGSFFLLDADTLAPLARRQLLPRAGGNGGFPGDMGVPIPAVDPHLLQPNGELQTENFYGVFSTAAVHLNLKRLFVGVGGFAYGVGTPGIDSTSTAFLRALNWDDLTDAWTTAVGADGIARYVAPQPPMYTTEGEAGFASPAIVNDLVFMATSRPGLYAFDAATGLALWSASGFGPPFPNSFTLGPVVYGDYLVVGSANLGLLIYSL